jgi:hypothetical protein
LAQVSRTRVAIVVLLLLAAAACDSGDGSPRSASPTVATSTSTATTAPARTTPTTAAALGAVTAIGDSVMIDAAPALQTEIPTIAIDAAESRSALPGPDILATLAARGGLGADIVIGLGSNGGMSERIVDEVLQIAGGRRVVMVTSHCPYCSWTPRGNAVIRSACVPVRGCFVADWDALAQPHPEWFARDGVHMSSGGPGAAAYAGLVRAQL